jgi:hypothetical protein
LLDHFAFHDHFRDAAGGKVTDKTHASNIDIVDFQSKGRREKKPKRSNDAQETVLSVRGSEYEHHY